MHTASQTVDRISDRTDKFVLSDLMPLQIRESYIKDKALGTRQETYAAIRLVNLGILAVIRPAL